jgi:hypothetical protein
MAKAKRGGGSNVAAEDVPYGEYGSLGRIAADMGGKAANPLMHLYGTLAVEYARLDYDARSSMIDRWYSLRNQDKVWENEEVQAWIRERLKVVEQRDSPLSEVEVRNLQRILGKLRGKGGVWERDKAPEEWRLLQADRCEGAARTFERISRGVRWKLTRTVKKGGKDVVVPDVRIVSAASQQMLVSLERRLAGRLCNTYLSLMLEWRAQGRVSRDVWRLWKDKAKRDHSLDPVAVHFCWMETIPDWCERLEQLEEVHPGHGSTLIRREISALQQARDAWDEPEGGGGVRLKDKATHGRIV